jgi:hypothetical protein
MTNVYAREWQRKHENERNCLAGNRSLRISLGGYFLRPNLLGGGMQYRLQIRDKRESFRCILTTMPRSFNDHKVKEHIPEFARLLSHEADAIVCASQRLPPKSLARVLDLLVGCKGKLITTGIGKSGFIARKSIW